MEFSKFVMNLMIVLCVFLNLVKIGHLKAIDSVDSESNVFQPEQDLGNAHNNGNDTFVLTDEKFVPMNRQFAAEDDGFTCNPPATAGSAQFIIGYGSLMQTASKDRTSPNTGENLPIRVRGYSRLWNCKGTSISYSTTYLGSLAADSRKSFVAATYKLPNAAALVDYDARESFYCREEVPMSKIQILTTTKRLAQGQYWIYVTKPEYNEEPSREYPIVQSYADTFLSGCIELEEKFNITDFAKECIRSTEGWDSPWVNDRIYPRRPFMHLPMAGKIDKLLSAMVPRAYRNIRIE